MLRITRLSPPAAPTSSQVSLGFNDLIETKSPRILDFDCETVSAGFEDPNWVPQKITCVAWSWVDGDAVESRICGASGIYGKPQRRKKMLAALLNEIRQADMLTGHNIARFDLPIVNAEAMRLGLEPVRSVVVQDTMWLTRSKGFKKGQDNLGLMFRLHEQKLALSWQGWQDAYDEDGWRTVRRRAESDVAQHKLLRLALMERGMLKPPRRWTG